jgi:hypothetical protein
VTDELDRSLGDAELTDRRTFLSRASALSLAIPAAGAALVACSPSGQQTRSDSQRAASTAGRGEPRQPHNSDSRLDSAVLKSEHRAGT